MTASLYLWAAGRGWTGIRCTSPPPVSAWNVICLFLRWESELMPDWLLVSPPISSWPEPHFACCPWPPHYEWLIRLWGWLFPVEVLPYPLPYQSYRCCLWSVRDVVAVRCVGWFFPRVLLWVWLSTGCSALLGRRFIPSGCYFPPASPCSYPLLQPDYPADVASEWGIPAGHCFHRLAHGSSRVGWILHHWVPALSTTTAKNALFPAGGSDCSWPPAAHGIIIPSPRSVSVGFPLAIRWLPPVRSPLLLSGRPTYLVVPRSPAAAGSRLPAIRHLRPAGWWVRIGCALDLGCGPWELVERTTAGWVIGLNWKEDAVTGKRRAACRVSFEGRTGVGLPYSNY